MGANFGFMSSISNNDQDLIEEPDNQSNVFSEDYELKDTDYIKDQLDFMESVAVGYPDGTEIGWSIEAPERYEKLVESFGEVDQYLKHFDDGSIAVLVEQEDEPLFALYGEEQGGYRQSRSGLSEVANSLSR